MGDMLTLIEKAQQNYDLTQAAKLEEKLRKSKLTLQDYYEQLQQLRGMVRSSDQTGLFVITQLSPTSVVFTLPEDDLPAVRERLAADHKLAVAAFDRTMATTVAAPLERQFGRIAGLTEMTSASSQGSTSVTLQFDLSRDIDGAARDVQAAINAARGYLPSTLRQNPTYRKINPADAPVLILGLTSETVSRAQMYDVASTVLQQKLSQVEGVGQVVVGGGALPAVRVDVSPAALAHRGLGLDAVRSFLTTTTVNRPKGRIEAGAVAYEVETNDQLHKASQYDSLVFAYRNGAPVRLSDVATITDSVEDVRASGLIAGKPAIMAADGRRCRSGRCRSADRWSYKRS